LGHRRIAFVGGGPDSHLAQVDRRRLNGYTDSMSEAGLAAEILHVPSEVSLPGGYAAAVDILGDPRSRPTAVVATCDEVAIGTMIAARRLGIRVPTDLSAVGIDDHEYAEMFGLTTLEQVPREQGAPAVELLLDQMDQPDQLPRVVRFRARLVLRTSTATAPLAGAGAGPGSAAVLAADDTDSSGRHRQDAIDRGRREQLGPASWDHRIPLAMVDRDDEVDVVVGPHDGFESLGW